jgi:protein ImuA
LTENTDGNTEEKMSSARRQTIARLQKALENTAPATLTRPIGIASQLPLKKLFPCGLPQAALIECLYRGAGCGTLALCMARMASRDGRAIAVIDSARQFYAPAAVQLGIDPQQLFIVRPENETDEIWALDQSIRCRGFAAVLWRGGKLGFRHLRRLQLACEKHDSLGLLLRPLAIRHQLAAAQIRLLVESVKTENKKTATKKLAAKAAAGDSPFSRRRLRVERLRGARFGAENFMELEIDDETGNLCEAVSLPASSRLASGRIRTA